jgi:hypothetical protein
VVFAERPSAAPQQALQLLARGEPGAAEAVLEEAAPAVKAEHRSGPRPLARTRT